jgi:DNA adenine methylase
MEAVIEKRVQEALAKVAAPEAAATPAVTVVTPTPITKPFMKWVGGKTQILDSILALFPTRMNNYHEPFLGGGSVLLGLLSHVAANRIHISGTIYASDANANLIALYKNIQSNPDALIHEIHTLLREYTAITGTDVNRKATTLEEACSSQESYYFWIRSRYNAFTKEARTYPIASAMLLFMNKTCFRGVYREGPNGFNVPFGNYKNPTVLEEEHIRHVSTLIKDVVFTVQDFRDVLESVVPGDFVYLDPPYVPETATSFVGYTADGFGLENHEALFQRCHDMTALGVKLLMSNAEVPLVLEAFPEPYQTKIISCRRAIHSKEPGSKTNEVLIMN